MIKYIQITIVFFLLISAKADNDNDNDNDSNNSVESLELEMSGCTFRYTEVQNSITFYDCTKQSTTSNVWKYCFQHCCSPQYSSSFPSPSVSALVFCQKVNEVTNNESNTMRIVIIAVLALIIVVMCICCICKWRRQSIERNSHHQNFVANIHSMRPESRLIEWTDEKDINVLTSKGIVWSKNAKKGEYLTSVDQPCTICLQGNTLCQLFCKHQFHQNCIGSWLRKSNICPCCRREHIKSAKIYCSMCRWNYYVVNYALLTSQTRYLPTMCPKCQEANEVKGEYSLSEMASADDNSNNHTNGETHGKIKMEQE